MKGILITCLLSLISFHANAEVTSAELFRSINERLSYMEDVALFKAKNHRPIEDIQRENAVIDKSKALARKHGFAPGVVTDFFAAQISVAKSIQYRYRADLLSQPSLRQPRDLEREVRPALNRLGSQSIQQMAAYCKNYGEFQRAQYADFNQAISVNYVTETDKYLLFEALLKVKL